MRRIAIWKMQMSLKKSAKRTPEAAKGRHVVIGSPLSHNPRLIRSYQEKEHETRSSKLKLLRDESANLGVKYNIVVPDVAFTTSVGFIVSYALTDIFHYRWQAMICYLYTGEIHFAPLTSQGGAEARRIALDAHWVWQNQADHLPLCSPKSMYRLADIVRSLYLLVQYSHRGTCTGRPTRSQDEGGRHDQDPAVTYWHRRRAFLTLLVYVRTCSDLLRCGPLMSYVQIS